LRAADDIETVIVQEGPETVAAVFLEPLQNTGGAIPPPPGYFARVREICDRYGVLLVSDEVICAFGRLGEWFAPSDTATSPTDHVRERRHERVCPLGGVLVSDRIAAPFLDDRRSSCTA